MPPSTSTNDNPKKLSPKSLFQRLASEIAEDGVKRRSVEARGWFLARLRAVGNINRQTLLKDPELVKKNKPAPGKMFMFFYDPKNKKTLPFYDKFPLILMVGPAEGGFYGLNLHYLEPRLRAMFLDKLMAYASAKNLTDSSKLRITYQILKGAAKLNAFAPCFKHYLFEHVRSFTMMVPAPEWDIAIFLPTEQFVKESKQNVWANSKKSLKAMKKR